MLLTLFDNLNNVGRVPKIRTSDELAGEKSYCLRKFQNQTVSRLELSVDAGLRMKLELRIPVIQYECVGQHRYNTLKRDLQDSIFCDGAYLA